MEKTNETRKVSKFKIITISLILAILVIILAIYVTNKEFRNFIDNKLFNKQLTENTLDFIELNSDDNPTCFAYDNYIGVLAKSTLFIYNNKGNVENTLSINVSVPIINTNGKYIVISEKDGNKFFVVNSSSLLWQGNIDGKINKISINPNGYVSIIASNSTYTSIVITFDNNGNELFKHFLPSTYAMISSISNNNDYLAIGEVNYSGTVIKSNIRIMSMDTAKLVYNFSAPDNETILNINYIDKNTAICAFSGSVYEVTPTAGTKIYDINDNTLFSNIDMQNTLALIEKQSSGLFSYEYQLKLKNLNSNNENLYILNSSVPKKVVSCRKNYLLKLWKFS